MGGVDAVAAFLQVHVHEHQVRRVSAAELQRLATDDATPQTSWPISSSRLETPRATSASSSTTRNLAGVGDGGRRHALSVGSATF
jgi:hypothetical protein